MIHYMDLLPAPFNNIASGYKTIELRLNDEKRQRISINDIIVFTNKESKETLKTKVINLYSFKTFADLYKALPLAKCGYMPEQLLTASPEDMYNYYSPALEKSFGVLGIEIELCNHLNQ